MPLFGKMSIVCMGRFIVGLSLQVENPSKITLVIQAARFSLGQGLFCAVTLPRTLTTARYSSCFLASHYSLPSRHHAAHFA